MTDTTLTTRGARPLPRPRADPTLLVQPWLDFLFAAAALTCLLFQIQLGKLGPLGFMGATAGYILLRPGEFVRAVGRSWFLLLIPTFALCSTLWSLYPTATLRAAVQLYFTVAASIALSAARKPEATVLGVAAATGAYVIVSLAAGHSVLSAGDVAFSGLNNGKNFMADMAGFAAIAASGVLGIAMAQQRRGLMLGAGAVLVIELYVMFLARSAGAVVAVGTALATFYGLAAFSGLTRTQRIVAGLLMAIVIAPIIYNLSGIADYATEAAFKYFKKDSTLTGRVYLWYHAKMFIAEHPWLGRGFGAFWQQDNPDAENMWAYFSIAGRAGFNFHNTFFENAVNVGYVGVAVIFGVVAIGLALMGFDLLAAPSVVMAFWAAFAVYELSRAGIEAIGPLPFAPPTLMLGASFAMAARVALSRAPAAAPRLRVRKARPVRTGPSPVRPAPSAPRRRAPRAQPARR